MSITATEIADTLVRGITAGHYDDGDVLDLNFITNDEIALDVAARLADLQAGDPNFIATEWHATVYADRVADALLARARGLRVKVQRHEVESWVNPSAWATQGNTEHAVDMILASGSDDEDVWVMLVHEAAIGEAEAQAAEARANRDGQIRAVVASGVSAAQVAAWLELTPARVGQILKDAR